MSRLSELLRGKKTYISAVALAILAFVHAMGWIDQSVFETLSAVVISFGAASLRSAVSNLE